MSQVDDSLLLRRFHLGRHFKHFISSVSSLMIPLTVLTNIWEQPLRSIITSATVITISSTCWRRTLKSSSNVWSIVSIIVTSVRWACVFQAFEDSNLGPTIHSGTKWEDETRQCLKPWMTWSLPKPKSNPCITSTFPKKLRSSVPFQMVFCANLVKIGLAAFPVEKSFKVRKRYGLPSW